MPSPPKLHLPWLEPEQGFPPIDEAWGQDSPMPGLLAAGGTLDVATLCLAYQAGIFPWYSEGQPILWWSPSPRMVLQVAQFRLHRSLRKTLKKFLQSPHCEIRFDTAFDQVVQACAERGQNAQGGTWILPEMQRAYGALHRCGLAHSVEVWQGEQLVGGLYCVALGQAVFGESMFSRSSDASKIALAALIAFSRAHGITHIDCQQNTGHLASLGGREVPRAEFMAQVALGLKSSPPPWQFLPLYWQHLMSQRPDHP